VEISMSRKLLAGSGLLAIAMSDRNQVAYALRADKNRVRLEFSSPKYESKLDILELKR
jgi:hypothetical protein